MVACGRYVGGGIRIIKQDVVVVVQEGMLEVDFAVDVGGGCGVWVSKTGEGWEDHEVGWRWQWCRWKPR